jgi:outer membrane receptor for ferrienterochelin and colicins
MKIYIVIYLLILSQLAFAEEPDKKPRTDAMLFGDVKCGGEHIPFATITIQGTTMGTAADATGHFKLTDLPLGRQKILVSAVGYKPYSKEIVFSKNNSITLLVDLEPDNIGIEQIVVTANRNAKSRRESPVIINSINQNLFDRTFNVTLSEGLNFSPGLRMENNCQNCGFSQVRMNGLEGHYTQILINSHPVFSGLAGVYGLELIPAVMIDRIEVIRGGGSSMYGSNAIAGTVNLITKDPVANTFSISNNYGTFGQKGESGLTDDFNLSMNGSFVTDDYKTGLSIFGFYRKRSPFDANNDGFTELSDIKNSTLGSRFYQRVASRGKITFDYFNINEYRRGGNKFHLPLHEADISESVRHNMHMGSGTFDMLMRDADKISLFFSGQLVDRDSYYGANQDLSAYGKTEDLTYTSGAQYTRQVEDLLFSPATINIGAEFKGSNLKDEKLGYYDIADDKHVGNTLIADQHLFLKSGFVQSEWNINEMFLSAGLRYDNYRVKDDTEGNSDVTGNVLSPRINWMYNLIRDLQLRAGYAKGFRAPQIFDEDLHIETSGSRQVLHRNDENLKQESSNSYSLSIDYTGYEGKCQYQLLVEGFYTSLKNPFANEYGTPDENGVVIYTRKNAEKGAIVKGVNMEFNISPSNKMQIQSGFTLQKSAYEEPQEFGETRFFRSPDNFGFVSLNYIPVSPFSISATANYTGPMLVPYFGIQLDNPDDGELRTSGSFFDLGLKGAYNIKITKDVQLEFNAGIKNIFNSYQKDFDSGINRDPSYIYGPLSPRLIYFGLKFGSLF